MRRERVEPRPGWREIVEKQGLTYAVDTDGDGAERPYWEERACYVFSEAEIAHLEATVDRLHRMSVEACRHMAADERYRSVLGLSEPAWAFVRESLDAAGPDGGGVPSLYGRFDLAWDGEGPVRMLEYNADTPAALVEAAVCQWFWLQDVRPDRDQWNLLHELLVRGWSRVAAGRGADAVHVAVGRDEPDEDWVTVAYLRDTAQEAGLTSLGITMESIGWHRGRRAFVDEAGRDIALCFAMYPWEWMLAEDFAPHLTGGGSTTTWLEPAWKLLAGSKALLVALWEVHPGDELLLPAFLDGPGGLTEWVSKPVFGWEGAGIEISAGGGAAAVQPARHTRGQARIWQQYTPLPLFGGSRPVLGAWYVDGMPAGLGVRESDGLVTDSGARFVPHLIDAPPSTPAQVSSWLS